MEKTPSPAPEVVHRSYQAAVEGSLAVDHGSPGLLVASGASTLDFLHRMSTNDLLNLRPGKTRATVLTTAIGRTVGVVRVIQRQDDALLIAGPGKAEEVRSWLLRHIFFNDAVTLSVPDEGLRLWGLYGPKAADEIGGLVGPVAPVGEEVHEVDGSYLWSSSGPLPGFHVAAREGLHRRLRQRWGDAETTASRLAYHAHRIERGWASVWDDLDDQTIPLEADLWRLVSFTKGCYIGQEVIARMESRNRLARHLVGARLEAPAAAPQDILRDDNLVGRLTSSAVSPRIGPIGLGLARTSLELPLEVRLAPSQILAELVPLPLIDRDDRGLEMRRV